MSKKEITIRVKPDEYIAIYKLLKRKTNKKLSQYVRKVLLQKTIVTSNGNVFLDEILSALNRLSREVSAIGNNFSQTVYKLHTLDGIPEIKIWAEMTESGRQIFLEKKMNSVNSQTESDSNALTDNFPDKSFSGAQLLGEKNPKKHS